MAKTIEDLKEELEMDRAQFLSVITASTNQVERDVCYGKLAIIRQVLTFLEENDL
jgi:hypothetical protein